MTPKEIKQLQDLLSKLFDSLDVDNMNALNAIQILQEALNN